MQLHSQTRARRAITVILGLYSATVVASTAPLCTISENRRAFCHLGTTATQAPWNSDLIAAAFESTSGVKFGPSDCDDVAVNKILGDAALAPGSANVKFVTATIKQPDGYTATIDGYFHAYDVISPPSHQWDYTICHITPAAGQNLENCSC